MGAQNGRFRHGLLTKEATADRRRVAQLLNEWRRFSHIFGG
jgi:hypothetical protein